MQRPCDLRPRDQNSPDWFKFLSEIPMALPLSNVMVKLQYDLSVARDVYSGGVSATYVDVRFIYRYKWRVHSKSGEAAVALLLNNKLMTQGGVENKASEAKKVDTEIIQGDCKRN